MSKILLVEDDALLRDAVTSALAQFHQVTTAGSIAEAQDLTKKDNFDLALLDLGLPDGDGFQLCTFLKSNPLTREMPMVVMSGIYDTASQVKAFDLGADDFVPKPFKTEELLARVRARLRSAQRIHIGPLVNDVRAHRFFIREGDGTRDLNLTPFEYRLLALFISRAGQTLNREQLIAECRGAEDGISERNVDLHICSLRKKIGKNFSFIRTIYSVGYIFEVDRKLEKQL